MRNALLECGICKMMERITRDWLGWLRAEPNFGSRADARAFIDGWLAGAAGQWFDGPHLPGFIAGFEAGQYYRL